MPKRIILIIDDEKPLVEMLKHFFEAEGYAVVCAYDAEAGLHRAQESNPHLVLLDINMPKGGGLDFYSHICGPDLKSKYPVLVMTGRSHMEGLFKDLNADGFIAKPFKIEDLKHKVSEILEKRHGSLGLPAGPKIMVSESGHKILVVEDDANALDGIVTLFMNQGYTMSAAKSGDEAMAKALSELPDVILMKVPLPDLPGDIIAFKLRQTAGTKHTPIVLYIPRSNRLDYSVTSQICQKIGIREAVESDDPAMLLKECEFVLKKA